jgi:hypothetical protein
MDDDCTPNTTLIGVNTSNAKTCETSDPAAAYENNTRSVVLETLCTVLPLRSTPTLCAVFVNNAGYKNVSLIATLLYVGTFSTNVIMISPPYRNSELVLCNTTGTTVINVLAYTYLGDSTPSCRITDTPIKYAVSATKHASDDIASEHPRTILVSVNVRSSEATKMPEAPLPSWPVFASNPTELPPASVYNNTRYPTIPSAYTGSFHDTDIDWFVDTVITLFTNGEFTSNVVAISEFV